MRSSSGFRYCPWEKKDIVAASPRIWSAALCRYARYWISGTGSSPARPAPRARPRMDCSSSRVSNTRAAPNRSASPRVTPYTPPLRATSSPNTSMPGRAARASASAALIDWARVRPPADSGSRPAKASSRRAGSAARPARPRPARGGAARGAPSPARRWPGGGSRRPRRRGRGSRPATPRSARSPRPGSARPPSPAAGPCRPAGRRPGRRRPRPGPGSRFPRPSPRGRRNAPWPDAGTPGSAAPGPRPRRPAPRRTRRPGPTRRRGSTRRPARTGAAAWTQPGGVRTLMPSPLSSMTISSGSGRCW